MKVVFTAAHGGFAAQKVPLGGGGAVCDQLIREWTSTPPFHGGIDLLTPAILGKGAPDGKALVRYSEREYAAFCRDFEKASTRRILDHYNPSDTAVLVNDVSEGPDFESLAARGFRIYTIYHVDVVAYVADIYARGLLSPKTMARAYEYLSWAVPDIAKLVFQKQKDSVLYSRKCIVPSQRVKSILRDCYPQRKDDFVEVVPWGTWATDPDEAALQPELQRLREELGLDEGEPLLLTLSRISPEKGQDRLLEALLGYPDPLAVIICGEPAFMQGRKHWDKLQRLAAALPPHIKVRFPGHVTGIEKQAFFHLADLYIFPSRHESYGLTLMEALHAGLPAICLDHQGARDIMHDDFGRIVSPDRLAATIRELLADPQQRARMSAAAREFALRNPFSAAAARIAALLHSNEA